MAETKREIERKYEATPDTQIPDLTGAAGIADVVAKGVAGLDADYYDTPGLRLAADGITLRRRTGGTDEGWHLKFPVATGIREEIHAPLADTVPRPLAGLVRSRTRATPLTAVVRLRSDREVHHLVDERGRLLAELSRDTVHAERLAPGDGTAEWTEIEVELADGADPALLDRVEKRLRKAGITPASSPSKLARALAETAPGPAASTAAAAPVAPVAAAAPAAAAAAARKAAAATGRATSAVEDRTPSAPAPADEQGSSRHADAFAPAGSVRAPKAPEAAKSVRPRGARLKPTHAGEHVLAYLREQRDALVALDPAVRRDLPDAVHQMRVATRRMRSAFKTFRKIIDPKATAPVGEELKWLAGELGAARDQEVMSERLRARLDALPRRLQLGPVRGRLRIWATAHRADARRRSVAVLDTGRYLALLDTLDALLDEPPLLPAATAKPAVALPKAVLKDYDRLAGRVEHALGLPAGHDRDTAMHDARKAAKRARYAAEAVTPALGKPAKKLAKRMKAVQTVLGDHQDSVVARETLRDLAVQAHAAGESAFTWGLLFGSEQATAADRERELPAVWADASRPEFRTALRG
ncbi:CYTH and CHAD domain-containing protein [Streptomyces sp. PKU-MA01144]|uniref:CYTH and CHAD domain-containing protein n=1 Tax=Streptomyces sp. PKU-MA01144 TaxID=2729138 RepID=UPI00147BA44A|nr:CYTH and CHAD domain-containing protein [Streptomyces sp. PKU-MA01144]NNJ05779.1 CYTH and CHAD domain-containing protein [Streptomyces sp. PKU-MA01144]